MIAPMTSRNTNDLLRMSQSGYQETPSINSGDVVNIRRMKRDGTYEVKSGEVVDYQDGYLLLRSMKGAVSEYNLNQKKWMIC